MKNLVGIFTVKMPFIIKTLAPFSCEGQNKFELDLVTRREQEEKDALVRRQQDELQFLKRNNQQLKAQVDAIMSARK